jgi:hypothetical protein
VEFDDEEEVVELEETEVDEEIIEAKVKLFRR